MEGMLWYYHIKQIVVGKFIFFYEFSYFFTTSMQSIDENERFLRYRISQKLFLIESPDNALFNKMREKKYRIVRTVPKSNRKILETETKPILLEHI